jgi:hypothetical protein
VAWLLPLPAETAGPPDGVLACGALLREVPLCAALLREVPLCAVPLRGVLPWEVPDVVLPDVVLVVPPAVVALALAMAAPPTAPATEMATSPVVSLVTRRRPRSRVFMKSSSGLGVALRAGVSRWLRRRLNPCSWRHCPGLASSGSVSFLCATCA